MVAELRRVLPTEADGRAFVANSIATTPLLMCIPAMRADHEIPTHLAPIADVIARAERAARGEGPRVLACVSAPPQTGKSTLFEVGFARWLKRNPSHLLAWVTYGQDLANEKSRKIRDDVRMLGVDLRNDSQAVDFWQTTKGGGLLSRGAGGALTGMPGLMCLLCDDLVRNKMQAFSRAHKRAIRDTLQSVIVTRRNPRTSIVVMNTRWTTDDPIGWLLDEHGTVDEGGMFENHRIAAVTDDGEPIVTTAGRDRAFWDEQRVLMRDDWWPLAMGLPRPLDGRLFKGGPPTYDERPAGLIIRIGVDFAYSKKTSADHNAAAVVGKLRDRYYVLRIVRRQCGVSEWGQELATLKREFPSATFHAYIGGTEIGTIETLAASPHHIRIAATVTGTDKYARAQRTASYWNGNEAEVAESVKRREAGEMVAIPAVVPRRIYVPSRAPWDLSGFLERTLDFTGADGGEDDEQDALVAAVDACGPPSSGPRSNGDGRTYQSEADRVGSLI